MGSVPEKSHNKLIGHSLIVWFFSLFQQVNTQRKAIVQLILEKRELLVGQRVKRDGTANLKPSKAAFSLTPNATNM